MTGSVGTIDPYACGAVDPRPLVAAAAGVWGRPPPSLAVSGVQNGATPQRSMSTRALTHDPDPTENIHTRTVAHPLEDRTAEVWLTTTPLPSAKSPDELRQQARGRSSETKGKELEEMRV
jgi:hypothetical protein